MPLDNLMCFMPTAPKEEPVFEVEVEVVKPVPVDVATGRTLLECDFDKNPSRLIKRIVAHKWNDAIDLLAEDEEPTDENAASASDAKKKSMCATWAVRYEENEDIRWRVLPIHAALIHGAPLQLIKDLIHFHPKATTCADDQGNLPIHLAFRYSAIEAIFNLVVETNPGGLKIKNGKGRTPLQCGPPPTKVMALIAKQAAEEAVINVDTRIASIIAEKDRTEAEADKIRTQAENMMDTLAARHEGELQALDDKHKATIIELKEEVEDFQKESREAYEEKCNECEELLLEKEALELNTFALEKNALALEKNTLLMEKKALALRKKASLHVETVEENVRRPSKTSSIRGLFTPKKSRGSERSFAPPTPVAPSPSNNSRRDSFPGIEKLNKMSVADEV